MSSNASHTKTTIKRTVVSGGAIVGHGSGGIGLLRAA